MPKSIVDNVLWVWYYSFMLASIKLPLFFSGRFTRILAFGLTMIFLGLAAFPEDTKNSKTLQRNSFLGEYVGSIWTASDGLPGNTVTDLMQSRAGYLYIGTYEGLVRFDGIEFKVINHVLDSKYAFTSARSVFEDSKNNIWVGANDEGAVCISPDGNVKAYTVESGLPNNSVRSIIEDKDGNIWIGTANGIVYITPEGFIKRPAGLDQYGAQNILTIKLYCDTAGRVWATSSGPGEIYCYSNGSFKKFAGFESMDNAVVYCVMQDKSGGLWFGVGPHYAVYVQGTDEKVYDIGYGNQPGTVVNDIFIDSSSSVWFARDTGVTILRNGQMFYYDHNTGLSDNNVNTLLEDAEGNMWFGTDRGGLEKLSLGKFNTVSMSSSVNAICDDPGRKVVWIGADDGLYCYDSVEGVFLENSFTRYCNNIRIRHVDITSDGALLVSTYEKLGQLLMTDEGIKSWTERDGLSGNRTRVSLLGSDGNLYVGTTNGLNIINLKDNTISIINKASGLENDYIMCIYEDRDHTVWCGTDGGGIFSVKKGNIVKCLNKFNGLAGDVVFKIQQINENDELWISTGTGISRLKDGEFFTIGTKCGLVSDSIFQMICDYTGTIWLTSNRGINSIKGAELEDYVNGRCDYINTKYFGRSDGLLSNGVTSTSLSMKDHIGRIWFTLTDGFAIYNPLKVTKKAVPPVQLERYALDTETYDYRGQTVVVAPGTKRLSIKFTGLSFISPEQILFRYCLKGFEADYSAWSTLREVSYTNLKPGTYYFYVQAQNSDENIGENPEPLVIIKKPYFWQLWWFWVTIVFVVVGFAVLINFSHYRRMHRYQRKLESEVEAQTKELHQQTVELQKQAEKLEIANHDLEKANLQSEKLLRNILPDHIATELEENPGEIIAKKYSNVAVLFADLVDFTKISDGLSAEEIVSMLNTVFSKFDIQASASGVEKIKTIGDSYMAAVGIDGENLEENSRKMINLALKFFGELENFNSSSPIKLKMRIGINTGNLVAGVIGKTKFIYDIWGDTVNVASRMESTGQPGKIHVTEAVYSETKDLFKYGEPEILKIKGKGDMKTYFIDVVSENMC